MHEQAEYHSFFACITLPFVSFPLVTMAFWKRRKTGDVAVDGLAPAHGPHGQRKDRSFTEEADGGAPGAGAAASVKSITGDDEGLSHILEALGGMVRAVGEFPFDTADMDADRASELCEAWARHALVGTACPVQTDTRKEPTAYTLLQRRWRDLRRFFVHHRRAEYRQVNKVQDELKSMIWQFAARLRGVVVDDDGRDSNVGAELSELAEVAQRGSLQELRAKVASTVAVVSQVISARQEKYQQHLKALGEQLNDMREDLLEARRQMEHDPLTGLYNRGAFDSALEHYVNLSFFSGQPLTLMLIDVDHFKAINDNFGHRAGDAVLREISNGVLRCFPRRNDFVARYGGEEIAVLLLDTNIANAERLADRTIEMIRQVNCNHDGQNIQVTCSAGFAVLRRLEGSESLLERADQALYRAKNGGRDRAMAA